MKTDILIIGGGVSGLLMAQRLKRDHPHLKTLIIDKPDNKVHPFHLHRPIDLPGLEDLKPAKFKLNVWDGKEFKARPNIADINHYAMKTFGHVQVTNISNVEDQTIYPIHKDHLTALTNTGVEVIEGYAIRIGRDSLKFKEVKELIFYQPDGTNDITMVQKCIFKVEYRYLISTIPLPDLLILAEVEHGIEFKNFPFYTSMLAMPEPTSMYQMIYNSDEDCNITRATLLDDKLFIETDQPGYTDADERFIYALFLVRDLPELRKIEPGRFQPIAQDVRKPLLHWLTEEHDIFTLGRFGAWTFKVTNDVWDDTKFISDLIFAKDQAHKYTQGGK